MRDRFTVGVTSGYPSAAQSNWYEYEYGVYDEALAGQPVALYFAGAMHKTPLLEFRRRQAYRRARDVCRELNKRERGQDWEPVVTMIRYQRFPKRGRPFKRRHWWDRDE